MIYRRDGIIFMHLEDPVWGEVKIGKILPESTSWGVFESVAEREEALLIPQVSDCILDRAIRGDCTPFMNSGVRDPKGCLKKITSVKECSEKDFCISYNSKICLLGNRKMPSCFTPLADENFKPIVTAWLEGYRVIREEDYNENE